jgi:hypothetical protein
MAEKQSPSSEAAVLMLCRDLMFTSKVTAAARATGVAVRVVREPEKLGEMAGRKLIVDLGQEGALDAAAGWRARSGGEVVGFVSHVDEQTIGRAREAGIDRVMSRGGFSASVEDILRS